MTDRKSVGQSVVQQANTVLTLLDTGDKATESFVRHRSQQPAWSSWQTLIVTTSSLAVLMLIAVVVARKLCLSTVAKRGNSQQHCLLPHTTSLLISK